MSSQVIKKEFTFGVLDNIAGWLCDLDNCEQIATGVLYDAYPSPECFACDACGKKAVKSGQITYPDKD